MTKQSNGNNAVADEGRAAVSHWLIVAGTLLAVMLALSPTLMLLWPKWSDSHRYSQGVLILLLVVWLVYRQRDAISATPQRPSIPAFVVLAGLLFGWIWAFAANIALGATVLWPLILICAVLSVSGWQTVARILVPVLLLYSAIPVWDVINPLLQSMTTAAVSVILKAIGVPAFIEGNFVQIPAGVFEIAGGCSGIHFFIVALTLATVYGHLNYVRARDSVALLAIAAAMSIAVNWIRVTVVIVAGHLTDMQSYLVQVDHYTFGWVLFVVMLVPFFLIARRLEPDLPAESQHADSPRKFGKSRLAPAGYACVLLALPVLVWARLLTNDTADVAIQLPSIEGWLPVAAEREDWKPQFVDPDGEAQARYSRDGRKLDVYVNWYETQSQGRELIGYYTSLAGKNARVSYDKPAAAIGTITSGEPLEIHEIMADYPTGVRRLIWYHFLVDGESRSKGVETQLRLGLLALVGAEQSGSIAVSTVCEIRDCNEARTLLSEEFPAINRSLIGALPTPGPK
ncbi:MAG: EpsI family protein [Woeseiaceae bacterium]|nr:EpsI family protein [Woeseiaceae bacterium]